MSGIYAYWWKTQHSGAPNNIPQMESGGYQEPFYFGGSQVPINLKLKEMRMKTGHKVAKQTTGQGLGKQITYHEKHSRIHMPRYIKHI